MLNKLKYKTYRHLIENSFTENRFPDKPSKNWKIHFKLNSVIGELKKRNLDNLLGELYQKPNPQAVSQWKKFLIHNPNHLGNWSVDKKNKQYATYQLEKEVILKLISLYKGDPGTLEGYITSGATEGNIFSAWLGRKYLEQKVKKDRICLIRSDLTHFSITKAADVTGVPSFVTPVNKDNWNISLSSLPTTLKKLYKKGFRGFMMALTLGYTVGGTDDDYIQITEILKAFKNKYKNVEFFVWIDAALSGLVLPFKEKNFQPFQNGLINTFIVDFHKFAGIPYPAGVILYKKELRKLIEQDTYYLKHILKDSTLLTSRPGIPAVAIWENIHRLGVKGYCEIINKSLNQKELFLANIKKIVNYDRIVTTEHSVAAVIITKNLIPDDLCKKHGLYPIQYPILFEKKKELINLYKLFFLPKYK